MKLTHQQIKDQKLFLELKKIKKKEKSLIVMEGIIKYYLIVFSLVKRKRKRECKEKGKESVKKNYSF